LREWLISLPRSGTEVRAPAAFFPLRARAAGIWHFCFGLAATSGMFLMRDRSGSANDYPPTKKERKKELLTGTAVQPCMCATTLVAEHCSTSMK
jgi:hypothetical protein